MEDVRAEIRERLEAERTRLRATFGMEDYRIAVLQTLRSIDYQTILGLITSNPDSSDKHEGGESDDDHETVSQLFKWGLNEALTLLWNEQMLLPGIPLVPTFPVLREWASAILQCSGRLRLVEFGMEMARVNLATVSKNPKTPNRFIFEYAPKAIGIESIEREDLSIFETLIKKSQEIDGIWKDLHDRRGKVLEMMNGLVSPWNDHFIQYGADPFIDEYYHDLSCAAAPLQLGWDAFPLATRFGGITFQKYIDCVRCLMGFALKHFDFCILLTTKNPSINLIDILTVSSDWDKSCEYVATALDLPLNEAEQIMAATIVDAENVVEVAKIPAAPFALHYKISSTSIVRLITGCLDHPFLFLLRELRRRYPEDWDRSVDTREDVFRRELATLLLKFKGMVVFSDNVNISSASGKTDIDLLAVDLTSGTAGIFQLKWQDFFGASIRERESRKTNLLKTGNLWIERVSNWLKEDKLQLTLTSLGMPKKAAASIRDARIFIIGRNFSHFSGEFETDSRAAWASWPQILRLMQSQLSGKSAFEILFTEIKKDSPITRGIRPELNQTIHFDDWEWVIQPSTSWNEFSG